MDPGSAVSQWSAIVPVKPLAGAKSRLSAADVPLADLALAFLQDVLTALADCTGIEETIVASADPRVREVATAAGALAADDTGHDGINAAVGWAATTRGGRGGVVVLVADLPCLTPVGMDLVLAAAASRPVSFVADAEGTGTTMWLTHDPVGMPSAAGPHFGPRSRAAHRAAGAVDLVAQHPGATGPWLPARLDVDTPADLDRARRVGLGAAATLLLDPTRPSAPATVLRIEADTVVLAGEDGRVSRLPVDAAHAAGWRHLRAGQRVLVADGRFEPGA